MYGLLEEIFQNSTCKMLKILKKRSTTVRYRTENIDYPYEIWSMIYFVVLIIVFS